LLASHQATMLILLSIGMIEEVVEDLVAGGYTLDTPVAVVCLPKPLHHPYPNSMTKHFPMNTARELHHENCSAGYYRGWCSPR